MKPGYGEAVRLENVKEVFVASLSLGMQQRYRHLGHRILADFDRFTGFLILGREEGRIAIQALVDFGMLNSTDSGQTQREIVRSFNRFKRPGRQDTLRLSDYAALMVESYVLHSEQYEMAAVVPESVSRTLPSLNTRRQIPRYFTPKLR